MKRKFVIIVAVLLSLVTVAFAASFKCPSCNSSMIWTGETKIEWGKMFYLHECPAGHQYWFKSSSAPSGESSPSNGFNSSQSLKCPVCGSSVIWTGETKIEWGKMFYLHECPAGHQYWFKSSSAPSGESSPSNGFNSSQSLKCPVCGSSVIWTGETKIEWGKMFKIYKCPAGHESVGK